MLTLLARDLTGQVRKFDITRDTQLSHLIIFMLSYYDGIGNFKVKKSGQQGLLLRVAMHARFCLKFEAAISRLT
jgi:hypothetical protein